MSYGDKPTCKRCALKTGHEGPHIWIQTRRLSQFWECRALVPVEFIDHIDGDPTNNALDNLVIRSTEAADG